jgi:hypothetical protein
MNTLIISNRLSKTSVNTDVELYSWTHDRPSAANYQNVILDLYFGPPDADGYVKLQGTDHNFYEIGPELVRCLGAGGIVVTLLGPVAVNERIMGVGEDQGHTLRLKYEGVATYDPKYKGDCETSYDWLDQGFLEDTRLDALYKKRSSNIVVLAKWEAAQKYFAEVKQFWSSIQGLEIYRSETQATLTYRMEEGQRWDISGVVCQRDAWILAVSEHTREPIAIATNYLFQPGLLVLVPPFNIAGIGTSLNLGQSPRIERLLVEFADSIREQIRSLESPDIPDWAKDYRAPEALKIAQQIEEHTAELDSLKRTLVQYDEMLYLLCAKGELLQRQVQKVFSAPKEGIRVEPTPVGSSLDLFIKDKTDCSLAVEVTGTKGKLTKSDSHWADFLNYLPEHSEKNQKRRVERIVLVVNTQSESPLKKRVRKDDITQPVLRIAEDNHICIIRSCDLYQLWIRILGGLPLQKVFDSLFDCEGIYSLDKVKEFLK